MELLSAIFMIITGACAILALFEIVNIRSKLAEIERGSNESR